MKAFGLEIALAIVAVAALGRVAGILILKVRQARFTKNAVALPRSWQDLCTVPEPYALGLTTLTLWLTRQVPTDPSTTSLLQVGFAALIALLTIGLMLWVLAAFPSVSTGHYVLPDQRVVREGPYAFVRHPLYAAAFLVWLAVSVGFGSVIALGIMIAYVIPGYAIYMRAEERMLLAHFGESYARYQREVGMLIPRLWSPRHGTPHGG